MQRKERRLFDRDGAVVAVAQYLSGVLDGCARVYGAFGSVIQEASFREVREEGTYVRGRRAGWYRCYRSDGSLEREYLYRAGAHPRPYGSATSRTAGVADQNL
jgi:hypothetical protein